MKIISLVAENVKKLVAVSITPDGNLVQITGKNGAGKTSILDSIWWTLAGASHIQTSPVRKGSNKARIRLDLGEIVVTRTFTSGEDGKFTTSITVENQDGARFPSPQKMLDSLLGALSFDPLAFARMPAKDQFDTLKRFVPGVDFDAIEKAHKADFERCTELRRFAKEARGSASMIVLPADTPSEPIDETALVDEMQKAGEFNAELERRKNRREQVGNSIATFRQQISKREARITELRYEIETLEAQNIREGDEADALQRKLDEAEALPPAIDVTEVRAKIEAARGVNANITKLQTKLKHEHLAIKYEQEVKDLTERMQNREAQKRAAVSEAKMPVPGIEFGDGIVLLNGVPFEQASDAERLRASVAIAAAMNPKLRVIRVREGSLLDEDGMRLLAALADASDMQVWIERVDSSGKIGFVLEDGHLKAQAAEEVAA